MFECRIRGSVPVEHGKFSMCFSLWSRFLSFSKFLSSSRQDSSPLPFTIKTIASNVPAIIFNVRWNLEVKLSNVFKEEN